MNIINDSNFSLLGNLTGDIEGNLLFTELMPINIVIDSNNKINSITITTDTNNKLTPSPMIQTFFDNLKSYYNQNGITIINFDIELFNNFIMPYITKLNNYNNNIINTHNTSITSILNSINSSSLLSYIGIILVNNNTNSKFQIIIPNILFTSNNTQLIDYILDNLKIFIPEIEIFKNIYKKYLSLMIMKNPSCTFANYIALIIRLLIISYIMQYIITINTYDDNMISIIIDLFINLLIDINNNNYIYYDPKVMNFLTYSPDMCNTSTHSMPCNIDNIPKDNSSDNNILLISLIVIIVLLIIYIIFMRLTR